MDLTKEEIDQLKQAKQVFKRHTLSRQQVEHTLHRKLTDKSWQAYMLLRSNAYLKSLKRNQNLCSHSQTSCTETGIAQAS